MPAPAFALIFGGSLWAPPFFFSRLGDLFVSFFGYLEGLFASPSSLVTWRACLSPFLWLPRGLLLLRFLYFLHGSQKRALAFLCTSIRVLHSSQSYLEDFLRLAKNRPAAMIMIAHPPMVKIVVPMPPVDGREERVVF